ncbi:YdhK family protein [Paenibacillus sp. P96]|uniref:YdhK family protein n=1 Tax=Paenibacillus zeirhizosphaerae TaxID=2987519 RepID=A0ABT9FUT2_9BACL|nr:YdhK family protein [Paenibacillus sp. P96]MDP4098217.1 YdhK family protein [Paenibacillus sp. P96]
MNQKKMITILLIVFMIGLSACGDRSTDNASPQGEMNHAGMEMDHSGSGEVPEGLKEAQNPRFAVGSQAVINADHMPGMNGAEATIVGAYDTIAYTIAYTPTTGGERVTNHKWIIHEEIENASDAPYEPGAEVTITADHMEGMKGAVATIESAEPTTVYMVDYVPATGGEKVTNHQWVTESELSDQ